MDIEAIEVKEVEEGASSTSIEIDGETWTIGMLADYVQELESSLAEALKDLELEVTAHRHSLIAYQQLQEAMSQLKTDMGLKV